MPALRLLLKTFLHIAISLHADTEIPEVIQDRKRQAMPLSHENMWEVIFFYHFLNMSYDHADTCAGLAKVLHCDNFLYLK